jgi:hypothetical protein
MELDLPTPGSQPPSWEHAQAAAQHTHFKNMFASINKLANFGEIIFYF